VGLFDLAGRLVRECDLGRRGPGKHEVTWSGLTAGRPLSAGVYFLAIEPLTARAQALRIVVIK
jgi:hypothetical protein